MIFAPVFIILFVGVPAWLYVAGHLDEFVASPEDSPTAARPPAGRVAGSYVPPDTEPDPLGFAVSVEAVPVGVASPGRMSRKLNRRNAQQWAERLAMGGSIKWR